MKVFISWSGDRSRSVARELRTWLPNVIQAVQPWMSEKDIAAGMRWQEEIGVQLEECDFGIICLNRDNLDAAWLNFEAGAIAKQLSASRVCPYLMDLAPTDVVGPLAQFQAKSANRDGTFELVESLSGALPAALDRDVLRTAFKAHWPTLEGAIRTLPDASTEEVHRSPEDILAEILSHVRESSRARPRESRDADIEKSLWNRYSELRQAQAFLPDQGSQHTPMSAEIHKISENYPQFELWYNEGNRDRPPPLQDLPTYAELMSAITKG